MFTVRFWFACSVISVRRTVLKPASSARISYVVGSHRWERVAPVGAGDRVGLDACGALDGRHRGARNHASAAVGKSPVDLSRALRKRVTWRGIRRRAGQEVSSHLNTPSSKGESGRREKVGEGKCRTTPWRCPAKSGSRLSVRADGQGGFFYCVSGDTVVSACMQVHDSRRRRPCAAPRRAYCDISLIIALR